MLPQRKTADLELRGGVCVLIWLILLEAAGQYQLAFSFLYY